MGLVRWSLDDLAREVRSHLRRGAISPALDAIASFISDASRVSQRTGIPAIGSAQLDALCLEVGAHARDRLGFGSTSVVDATTAPPADLYIATALLTYGGHTPALRDFRIAQRGHPAEIVITGKGRRAAEVTPELLARAGFDPASAICLEAGSRAAKLKQLLSVLARRPRARVFLFIHANDSVATAAMLPALGTRCFFVHHIDRGPSLGPYIEHATHVDLTPYVYHNCAATLRERRQLYAPIAVEDLGLRPPRSMGQPLTTATSGSIGKFAFEGSCNYADVISQVLAATSVRHVHIGNLTDATRGAISNALQKRGIELTRFEHVPHVPSLWRAMHDLGIDVYLNSFPMPGARASVEVMGSATPVVWYSADRHNMARATQMKYSGAAVWSEPQHLVAIIAAIDGPWLEEQASAARQHYERHHQPIALARAIESAAAAGPPLSFHLPHESATLDDLVAKRSARRKLRRPIHWLRRRLGR